MRFNISKSIVLFAMIIPQLSFAQEKESAAKSVALTRVWRVGEVQKYRKTVVSHMTNSDDDQRSFEFYSESKMTSYWTQTVLSVDKKGTATVKIQWTRFVVSFNDNGENSEHNSSLDTDEFDKMKEPKDYERLMFALLKVPVTVKIDNKGRMFELSGVDQGVKDFLKKEKKSKLNVEYLTSTWSNKAVLNEFQTDLFSLPSQSLKVQSKWNERSVLTRCGTVFNYENWSFQLASVKTLKTGTLAVVKGESSQSKKEVDPKLNMRSKIQLKNRLRSHKFRAVFNIDRGLFQQVHSTRNYTTRAVGNGSVLYSFNVKETRTVQLRKKGKKSKAKKKD